MECKDRGMVGGPGKYRLLSNRESGDGRADIMMLPEDEQSPVLFCCGWK